MPEVITNNLDLWSSAILKKSTAGRGSNGKLEAYGIKKLRELILELAVRGKLVPQDPNDEPASVLLERIANEKARLIDEGKIKREKPLAVVTDEEKHHDLPVGWVFVRLGDVAFSQAGFAFMSRFFNESAEGLPLIRIRDVGQPFTGTYYSGEYREEFLVEKGDYLISMDGEFRVSPWTNGRALLNQRVSRLLFYYEGVGQRFIADSLQARLRELQGVKAYTTVDHLSGTQITESVIGLPPFAEQHRIVAKVDELMALCDQLEQQQTHSIAAHQTLVETLLGTLTRVASSQELTEAWIRIANHFDTLFTTEHSIDQLKQTILQLAVMGKLVPQDPSDEPANVLLKRIQTEKAKLIAEGTIKKDKPLPSITEDEKRFELPQSWEWISLSELMPEFQNGVSSRGDKDGKPATVLRLADIKNRRISLDDTRTIPINSRDIEKYKLLMGDILITRVNGSADIVGSFILNDSEVEAIYCDHFIRMRISSQWINANYLCLLGESSLVRNKIQSLFITTAGQKTVNQGHIGSLPIALPPLAEQHRIVAKVDELMALCDALKTRLNEAQTTQIHLADAIVEQAVA